MSLRMFSNIIAYFKVNEKKSKGLGETNPLLFMIAYFSNKTFRDKLIRPRSSISITFT